MLKKEDLAKYISPEELAVRWEITNLTLKRWRWESSGPLFTKIGRKIFYSLEAVKIFEKEQTYKNTAQKRREFVRNLTL